MSLTLTHDRSFDQAPRTAQAAGPGAAMSPTASRWDQIIALIDACLLDLGPVPEAQRPLAEWSATEPTECSR
jgi:hypothetical protein